MFQSRPIRKDRAVFVCRAQQSDYMARSQDKRWNYHLENTGRRITQSVWPQGILAILCMVCMVSCSHSRKSTTSARFQKKYSNFRYCELKAVRQSSQISCGAAALTAVLNYWKNDDQPEFSEKDLINRYPPRTEEGYPILQLRKMALENGALAFAVTMDENPWKQLTEHVDKGRPVIAAVRLPRGRYFGKPIPLLETLDRRTLMTTGKEWKSHYVVVIGRNYKDVLFMDPEYGIVHTNRDAFMEFWRMEKYAALVCSAPPPLENVGNSR